ncbi:MAG: hypothetical protein H8E13_01890, partial [Actinobacteria bacterium]|nr:hypothetical protein [Actinomycetota bacterium]
MAFSCSDAVQLICNKLNDPNREVYADASYYGDAYDTFWECVNDLLIEESYKTEDVHGLVNDLSVTIPASGVIDISDEAPDMLRVVGHYTDPEDSSSALNKVVKNVSFEFFNQMK